MIDNILQYNLIEYNKARLKAFRDCISFNNNEEYDRILKARYNKVSRIKKHLVYLIYHKKYHYFITFTFNDKMLSKCDRTKRDSIKSALNTFSDDIYYILNIDFGSKNDREHFHCIVGTDNSSDIRKHLESNYPCFIWCEPISYGSESVSQLSKYVNKLTNHCCKNSTKNKRIVYNFKSYEIYKYPMSMILYLEHCDNLCLW